MFTEFQAKKMTNLFHVFDANKNGYIEKNDFELIFDRMVELLKWEANTENYNQLKAKFDMRWIRIAEFADTNRDGKVTLSEWLLYCENMLNSEEGYDKHVAHIVNFIFDLFDTEGNGSIPKDGLKMFYKAYGLDPELAEQTFSILDLNGDGKLSSDELTILYGQFHKSNDINDPGNHFFGILKSTEE